MAIQLLTVNSTVANIWSSWGIIRGAFNMSIVATTNWVGTATVQRKFGSTGTALDVVAHTTSYQDTGLEPEDDVYYRIGVKTGEYTAGSVDLRISQ